MLPRFSRLLCRPAGTRRWRRSQVDIAVRNCVLRLLFFERLVRRRHLTVWIWTLFASQNQFGICLFGIYLLGVLDFIDIDAFVRSNIETHGFVHWMVIGLLNNIVGTALALQLFIAGRIAPMHRSLIDIIIPHLQNNHIN